MYSSKLNPFLGGFSVDHQHNYFLVVGFLPRVEMGARVTGAYREDGSMIERDLSVQGQLLLLKEGRVWPSVMVGAQDILGKAKLLSSRYVAINKSFFGLITPTMGYGFGPNEDKLEGVFGGVVLTPLSFLEVLGEYDGDGVNSGIRLKAPAEKWPLPGIVVDTGIQDIEGERDFFVGVFLSVHLEKEERVRFHKILHEPMVMNADPISSMNRFKDEMINEGFLDVDIDYDSKGHRLEIICENGRYLASELRAIRTIFRAVARLFLDD